jgi:hypothetical protein
LVTGLSSIDVINPERAAARYGDAAPAHEGRTDDMACLGLRTTSLDQVEATLEFLN